MKVFTRILAAVLALVTFMGGAVNIAAFEDVNSSPHKNAIESLADMGLVKGISETEFDPNRPVARHEMALFIARIKSGLNIDDSPEMENDTIFTDLVNPTFNAAISYCYKHKIIEGRGDNIFDPLGTVSVQEALTMAIRAMGYTTLDYPDGYISHAKKFGLLAGLEDANYFAGMTRDQVAQLMYNTLNSPNLRSPAGESFADTLFKAAEAEDIFKISNFNTINDNFTYKAGTLGPYETYTVNGVEFLDEDGDVKFIIDTDKVTVYRTTFTMSLCGEVISSPDNSFFPYVVNPASKLSAAEAEKLISALNEKLVEYLGVDAVVPEYTARVNGSTGNVYEDTARNYGTLTFNYRDSQNRKWHLRIYSYETDLLKADIFCQHTKN